VTSLRLDGADELGGLRAYLGRLVGLDGRACVRLQGRGVVLGVWGGPPFDVVTLRPVALAEPLAAALDVTVSARRMLDHLTGDEPAERTLPAPVPGPPWAGLLPPRAGWTTEASAPAGVVQDAVRGAVEAFRRRVEALAEPDRSQAALAELARQIWAAPVLGPVPMRAAHAAELTGLLGRLDDVTALAAGPWLRLACPGGSVAVRRDSPGAGLGLDLGVWSQLPTPAAR
jgi:hypothetical protein